MEFYVLGTLYVALYMSLGLLFTRNHNDNINRGWKVLSWPFYFPLQWIYDFYMPRSSRIARHFLLINALVGITEPFIYLREMNHPTLWDLARLGKACAEITIVCAIITILIDLAIYGVRKMPSHVTIQINILSVERVTVPAKESLTLAQSEDIGEMQRPAFFESLGKEETEKTKIPS